MNLIIGIWHQLAALLGFIPSGPALAKAQPRATTAPEPEPQPEPQPEVKDVPPARAPCSPDAQTRLAMAQQKRLRKNAKRLRVRLYQT